MGRNNLQIVDAHRDDEHTPDPSQEGNRCRAPAVLLPSWEGLGVGRFMGKESREVDARSSAVRLTIAASFEFIG